MSVMSERKKVTLQDLLKQKETQKPIKMMTAYDYPSAVIVDEANVDITLVGDSLAMTVLGHPDTISVTVDEMVHHCKAVARGTKHAFLVGDMPFLSYHASAQDAIRNAGGFLKKGRMDAVKLEGGTERIEIIRAVVDAGIPVMGHVGLTPQSATQLGGFKVQGRSEAKARKILEDALAVEEAGCFSIVVESVPGPLAKLITEKLRIPTIGIGAGVHCDGQVLVFHDILGLFDQFQPKFVKRYADAREVIAKAMADYCDDVENRRFPGDEHSFKATDPDMLAFIEKQSK